MRTSLQGRSRPAEGERRAACGCVQTTNRQLPHAHSKVFCPQPQTTGDPHGGTGSEVGGGQERVMEAGRRLLWVFTATRRRQEEEIFKAQVQGLMPRGGEGRD